MKALGFTSISQIGSLDGQKLCVLVKFLVILFLGLVNQSGFNVEAKGDDIIMLKGKLIVRGAKGKGNLILDTGKSESQPMIPFLHVMSHFNPYSFYPMQNQHQPIMMQPIYIEDHSAMQNHHHQEQQQQQQQQKEPENNIQEHHIQYHHEQQQQQHQPEHLEIEQQQPEQQHHHMMEMQHYEEPEQHNNEQEQQIYEQSMMMNQGQHNYEQIGSEQQQQQQQQQPQDEHHAGYDETNQMLHFMSAQELGKAQHLVRPLTTNEQLQQLASIQASQQPIYAHHLQQAQLLPFPVTMENLQNQHKQQQQLNSSAQQPKLDQVSASKQQDPNQTKTQSKKLSSLLKTSANNPLMAIIKPLFKREPATTNRGGKNFVTGF